MDVAEAWAHLRAATSASEAADVDALRRVLRALLDDAVGIAELRDLLGRTSRAGGRVSRNYAVGVANHRNFPEPVVQNDKLRLWLRADVEAWLDANRPGWRGEAAR